jgi:Ca2+-binding EF-hand superfamily protein
MGAGQRIVLPALDEKLVMLMATYHLTPPEMVRFLKLFRKLDKSKSQMVDLDDFFKFLDIERSDYTDSLLDMLNIDYHESGEINFRDFLIYVVTYGFFETADILKFCLQIFDQDKNGFFANDEFQTLMRVSSE